MEPRLHERAGTTDLSSRSHLGVRTHASLVVILCVVAASCTKGPRVAPTPTASSPTTSVLSPVENGVIYFRPQMRPGIATAWEAISPDGTGLHTVFPASGSFVPDHLAFSPDGEKVAAELFGRPGIWIADADGSHAVQLTHGANDAWPAWSPDGHRIAFAGNMASTPCPPQRFEYGCRRDLYVMNADGTGLHPVAKDGISPSWSPDGDRIAFETNGPDIVASSIEVVNADGTGEHVLTGTAQGGGLSPAWSPDGRTIVYSSIRGENWGIYAVPAAGGLERALLPGSSLGYVDDPTWSPDGRLIAFVGGGGIDLMDPDGSHVMSLVVRRSRYPAGAIAWRPLPTVPRSTPTSPTPAP
jgi:hypothetical protein